MLTFDQFETQFNKLESAFSTSKPPQMVKNWYEEFKPCDYFTFVRAIKILQRGDRFPNWGMVWDTYTPILPEDKRPQERKGCDHCVNGRVFFVDQVLSRKGDPESTKILNYSLVGNCGSCSEDVINGFRNVYRSQMVLQPDGSYWTQRALKALPEEEKKVEADNKKRHEDWKKYHRFSRRGEY